VSLTVISDSSTANIGSIELRRTGWQWILIWIYFRTLLKRCSFCFNIFRPYCKWRTQISPRRVRRLESSQTQSKTISIPETLFPFASFQRNCLALALRLNTVDNLT